MACLASPCLETVRLLLQVFELVSTVGQSDGSIISWSLWDGAPRGMIDQHRLKVCSIAYSPDDSKLASGT